MHSSRMHTTRLLTISQHALIGGCTCLGGFLPRGCTCPVGVPAKGVYLPGTVYLPEGVYLPRGCTCAGTHPVNRMTDRCKNITLPQTSFAGGNKTFGNIMYFNRIPQFKYRVYGGKRKCDVMGQCDGRDFDLHLHLTL